MAAEMTARFEQCDGQAAGLFKVGQRVGGSQPRNARTNDGNPPHADAGRREVALGVGRQPEEKINAAERP
ncbi:hypothetical protein [Methylibium sp.]|uniref:hypothetical protein n=1 Tax=Methylibium sp. TaxID=2067992 RepID=UPI00286AB9B1|nr:hypothetical protein [Methylibium sp.]